ncbi:hypothetical protein [Winogradskyella sp.]|jgi:hypothetical protein|uniref:hypothetical protein n=1 Tax=Winogradskyella sp. TaxID=1883156 RepID=UPI0025F8C23D|nr:hypothetical protein [Winogradskyella sp.]MCT4628254.1 hypothetical protein [Winogradskyella sp.]
MKPLYLSLICVLIVLTCQSDKKKEDVLGEEKTQLTTAEKIAVAHGIENWDNVKNVEFTFKVIRDGRSGHGRRWVWDTKTGEISLGSSLGALKYNRNKIDSISLDADKAFINDKYWLLVPFQLVWDTTATISESKKMVSPIKKDTLQMITITYPNEGGYTPGDAYDIYYDKNYMIKEWVFREGNSKEPTLTNTFENYQDFNGIKIAIDHKKEGGNWNLNFTDVSITVE